MPIYQVKVNQIKTQPEPRLYIEADTIYEAKRTAINDEIIADLAFDEVYDYEANAEILTSSELNELGDIKIIKAKDITWN